MICKYSQYRLSSLEGAAPKGRLRLHIQNCSDCREYKEQLAGLDHALSSNATRAPSPVLREKHGIGMGMAFSTGALVAVAAVALFWVAGSETKENGLNQPAVAALNPTTQVASESPTPEETSLSQSIALSKLSVIHQVTPLEHELDAWRDDGRRGLERLLSLGQQ